MSSKHQSSDYAQVNVIYIKYLPYIILLHLPPPYSAWIEVSLVSSMKHIGLL